LFHPDQSDQVDGMINRYQDIVKKSGGNIHRLEDWGRRTLAYPIQKVYKAHYVLMNIECFIDAINELKQLFRYNDAIIRSLVLKMDAAVTELSPIKRRESNAEASLPEALISGDFESSSDEEKNASINESAGE
jgi:small subunit ribosomal protein S6